ncbi:MAG: NUDIX domain-containing protein, partial [Myxococcales bacterium]|nr:NUDIX domain-containing protein [Myxococcales bacterium]
MTPAAPRATTLVVAGVIIEGQRVLLTRRKCGTHLEGAWEFPGGKLHDGEDPRDGLRRELRE